MSVFQWGINRDVDNEEFPVGSYCDWRDSSVNDFRYYYIHEEYKGMCIEDREYNTYWDSDFYMIVWDEESQSPKKIVYASTAYPSGPAMRSYVDATPEVKEKYQRYLKAEYRRVKIQAAWDRRAMHIKAAEKMGISRKDYFKLYQCYGDEIMRKIEKLLSAKLRSEFRKSLKEQIMSWLGDKNPKYAFPLSDRQLDYI